MTEFLHADKVGIVINPNAKRVREVMARRKFFWEEFFEESKVEITQNVPAIPAALKRLKEKNINILAVYGGDGTLQQTVTAAINVWGIENLPAFLVLKGGTANALIKNMGVRKKARTYLKFFWKLLAQKHLHKVEIFEVPTLRVEDMGINQVNYGFLFANGLAYKSILDFHNMENPGAWETLKVGVYPIIAHYLGLRSAKDYFKSPIMTVKADGKYEFTEKVNMAIMSTLKKLILFYAPFSGGIMGTNGFYGLINYMDLDDVFSNLISLSRGKYVGEGHINEVLHDVMIKTDEGYMLDGELFIKDKPYDLHITRGPNIRVVILPVL